MVRYYYGYHYQVVCDFLGATGYTRGLTTISFLTTLVIPNASDANSNWNPFGGKIDDLSDMITYNDGESTFGMVVLVS